jgi:hypothetical protein
MDATLLEAIGERARHRCEYCQMPQQQDETPYEIDHIIAKKHHGQSVLGNLALSCFHCNSFKGSDIAGRDPETKRLTPFFNPRRHKWERHFRWDGPHLSGRTPIGRVTIDLLQINHPLRVELREELIREDLFPPRD